MNFIWEKNQDMLRNMRKGLFGYTDEKAKPNHMGRFQPILLSKPTSTIWFFFHAPLINLTNKFTQKGKVETPIKRRPYNVR